MSSIELLMADDLAQRAERLLELWSRLAMQHVALGAACACGTGGISLRLDDFEIDIVDYLEDAGQRSDIAEVVTFFEGLRETGRPMRMAKPSRPSRPLAHMLENVQRGHLPEAVATWLLPRLERTIDGIAQEHGPRQAQ